MRPWSTVAFVLQLWGELMLVGHRWEHLAAGVVRGNNSTCSSRRTTLSDYSGVGRRSGVGERGLHAFSGGHLRCIRCLSRIRGRYRHPYLLSAGRGQFVRLHTLPRIVGPTRRRRAVAPLKARRKWKSPAQHWSDRVLDRDRYHRGAIAGPGLHREGGAPYRRMSSRGGVRQRAGLRRSRYHWPARRPWPPTCATHRCRVAPPHHD